MSERESDPGARLAQLADTLDALPSGKVLATSAEPEDEMLAATALTLDVVQAVKPSVADRIDSAEWDQADRVATRVMLKSLQTAGTSLRWTAIGVARRLERAHHAIRDVEHFLTRDARLEKVRAYRRAVVDRLWSGEDPDGGRQ